MKRKEKNKTVNKNLIILVVVALTFTVVLILNSNKTNTPLPASQPNTSVDNGVPTRIYRSKDLKFSVNVPSKFEIEEKFTTILLKYNDELIQINRNGTNFGNAEDYLRDLSVKNKIIIENKKDIVLNELNAVSALIKYPGGPQDGEKIYYIYNNYAIYSLSTSSPALFADLDKIAQSFRYTP